MSKIAIIADSSCCLPGDLRQRLGITVVPLSLQVDDKAFEDGELTTNTLFHMADSARSFPSTSAPSPGTFLGAFRDSAKKADAVLCITLSARFSGTYDAAVNAAKMMRLELPEFPIRVFDSHNLAMADGFVVLAAARAAADGVDLDRAEAAAETVSAQTHLLGVIDTMRYLAKSGRVPSVVHWASSVLQIKPIISARQEEVKALGKVRTKRRALSKLIKYIQQSVESGSVLHMAVMHSDALLEAETLAERLRRDFSPAELIVTEFTPVMGLHAGPGFLGVSFYSE